MPFWSKAHFIVFNAIPTGFGNNLDSLFFYHNVIPTGFYDF